MLKRIEKQIDSYYILKKELPTQIEINKDDYKELEKETKKNIQKVFNCKIIINNDIDKIKLS